MVIHRKIWQVQKSTKISRFKNILRQQIKQIISIQLENGSDIYTPIGKILIVTNVIHSRNSYLNQLHYLIL